MFEAKITWFLKFFLVIVLLPVNLSSQETLVLNRFAATEFKGTVFLSWQLAKGSTCNGIQVFRSSDSLNFESIGHIFGVCGSVAEPVNYDFTDENPVVNRKSYYRLLFGNVIESEVVSIEIIDVKRGFLLRPNPIYSQGKLYFQNDTKKIHDLFLVDLNGRLSYFSETKEDFFPINSSDFPAGIYSFQIVGRLDGVLKAEGRVVIAR
jgi:hypothetical protein